MGGVVRSWQEDISVLFLRRAGNCYIIMIKIKYEISDLIYKKNSNTNNRPFNIHSWFD